MNYDSVTETAALSSPRAYARTRAQLGYPAENPAEVPSSSSSEGIRAYARITALCDCDWENVYQSIFGREPSVWDRRDAAFYLNRGIAPELLILALRDTTAARRPSWSYTVAILRRCLMEGCKTVDDWDRRKTLHAEAHAQRRKVAAQDYGQRQYTQSELDSLYESL